MAKKPKKKSKGWLVFSLIIVAVVWYFNNKEQAQIDADQYSDGAADQATVEERAARRDDAPKASVVVEGAPKAVLAIDFTVPRVTSSKWDLLEDCHLVYHRNNDGDSFHVEDGGGKKTEFRLYFVDTPESRLHQYNGERLDEQADYFYTDRELVIEVGKAAKKFVLDLLGKQSFRVVTQWENVYGPERKYCYVLVQWEGEEVYLHELLVAKGLVRIHTKPMMLPDGTSSNRQRKRLFQMQDDARSQRIGAWGL